MTSLIDYVKQKFDKHMCDHGASPVYKELSINKDCMVFAYKIKNTVVEIPITGLEFAQFGCIITKESVDNFAKERCELAIKEYEDRRLK